jgi:hypothetical protein
MKIKYLTKDSVSVVNENGIWKAYENSERGRKELQAEVPEPYSSEILAVWGDTPTIEEPIVEYIPPEPTETEMIMLAIAELDMQREIDRTEIELAIAELAETLLGGI